MLGTVAHTCNLSYLGSGDQEITVGGQPGQKVHETTSLSIKTGHSEGRLSYQPPGKHK
jgi:hypothetical protein